MKIYSNHINSLGKSQPVYASFDIQYLRSRSQLLSKRNKCGLPKIIKSARDREIATFKRLSLRTKPKECKRSISINDLRERTVEMRIISRS